jgi:hypothetical protein
MSRKIIVLILNLLIIKLWLSQYWIMSVTPESMQLTLISWYRSTCRTELFALLAILDRFTPVCEMHVAFKIHYVYYYLKLCRKKAEAMHRKHERLKIGSGQAYNCSSD